MKRKIILLAFVCMASLMYAQNNNSIKKILDNPGPSINEIVKIEGIVVQYFDENTNTTAYYVIKDDFGAHIKVQTSTLGAPETNKKYMVKGYLNRINNEYVIQEISRESIEKPVSVTPSQPVTTYNAPVSNQDNTLLYIILGIAGVLIVVLIIVFATKNSSARSTPSVPPSRQTGPPTQPITARTSAPKTIASQGFTTIRFESAPKTMKFIPGKFIITSLEDKGKIFQIAGFPSHGDAVVTIGREEVKGERSYAHIKLDDKFKTVSRKQAELVYSNHILYVINRSESNYTQVDGFELKPGEKREVKKGSVIRMGELEFKYEV